MLGPDFEKDLQQIGTGAAVFMLLVKSLVTFLGILSGFIVTLWFAFESADGSFAQAIRVKLAGGFIVFFIARVFLEFALLRRVLAPVGGLLAAIVLCVAAYYLEHGALHELLIDIAGGLFILVLLDLFLHRWFHALGKSAADIAKSLDEMKAKGWIT